MELSTHHTWWVQFEVYSPSKRFTHIGELANAKFAHCNSHCLGVKFRKSSSGNQPICRCSQWTDVQWGRKTADWHIHYGKDSTITFCCGPWWVMAGQVAWCFEPGKICHLMFSLSKSSWVHLTNWPFGQQLMLVKNSVFLYILTHPGQNQAERVIQSPIEADTRSHIRFLPRHQPVIVYTELWRRPSQCHQDTWTAQCTDYIVQGVIGPHCCSVKQVEVTGATRRWHTWLILIRTQVHSFQLKQTNLSDTAFKLQIAVATIHNISSCLFRTTMRITFSRHCQGIVNVLHKLIIILILLQLLPPPLPLLLLLTLVSIVYIKLSLLTSTGLYNTLTWSMTMDYTSVLETTAYCVP